LEIYGLTTANGKAHYGTPNKAAATPAHRAMWGFGAKHTVGYHVLLANILLSLTKRGENA